MSEATFPVIHDFQNEETVGIILLNDRDTFSDSVGSAMVMAPATWDGQSALSADGSDFADNPRLFDFNLDGVPYAARALFQMLGIDPEGKTRHALLAELNGCAAGDGATHNGIIAARLLIDKEA